MKKEKDNDMPVGQLTIVKNDLPPPESLVFPDQQVKITLRLTKRTVTYFKRLATKNGGKYQKMISRLLDYYSLKNAA